MKVVSILILTVAGIIFVISLAISTQSFGLDQGLQIGEIETEEKLLFYKIEKPEFSADGPRTYEYLSEKYGFICLFIVLTFGSGLILRLNSKSGDWRIISSNLVGILGSALCLRELYGLMRVKSGLETYFWFAPRNAFAKMTLGYDWLFVVLIIILLMLQSIVIFNQIRMRFRLRG